MTKISDDIYKGLEEAFSTNPEDHARVIFFLTDGEEDGTVEPFIRSLEKVKRSPQVFKQLAIRMADDTKTAEKDPKFRQVMQDVWTHLMKEDLSERQGNGQEWALSIPNGSLQAGVQFNFMRVVAKLPDAQFVALREVVQALCRAGPLAKITDRALSAARTAKPVVKVVLVAAYLAWDVIKNLRSWWKGEISGKRCVKNILDSGVSIAAGIAGGVGGEIAGAAIGALAGPVGAAVGGIIGAITVSAAASIGAESLMDRLTQWCFGLPKSEALENAYNFLGLPASASNSDINSKYRKLALQYHPDKGGDAEKWTRLQYSLAVIKEARDEY